MREPDSAARVIMGVGTLTERARLRSRFAPPEARDDLVVRARIVARLRASTLPVVCMRAPAGYGKTTALSQWAAQDPRPFAWISIDVDDDPVTLASRLTAAVASVQPVATGLHPVFTGGEPGYSTVVLPTLARRLGEASTPFVLVLDDAQLVTDPAAVKMIALVINALPRGSQLVLSARSEPPIALGRLRTQGRVLELGAEDLVFDPGEARILLAGTGLSAEATDAVIASSEGWPAGVYLAGLAVRAGGRRCAAVPSTVGSERIIVDYLRSELWSGVDEPTIQFLTRTSILSELSGPLCDAVLASRGAGTTLRRLRGSNMLLVPLDSVDHRYRYHRLLLEALRSELQRRESDVVPVLHGRASRWFEANGHLDAAIRHAKLAGDHTRTAELVWANIRLTLGNGPPGTLPRWLEGMSEAEIAGSPELVSASAWVALLQGDLETMGRWILVAQAHFAGRPTGDSRRQEVQATLELLRALRGDMGFAVTEPAADAFARMSPVSPWRPFACFMTAIGHVLAGNPAQAIPHLRRGESLAADLGVHLVRADCLSTLGLLAIEDGRWAQGAALVARAGDVIADNRLTGRSTSAYTMSVVALVQARAGETVTARATLAQARRLTAGLAALAPWFQVLGRSLQATASFFLHDISTARLLTREARQLLDDGADSPFLRSAVQRSERTLVEMPADPSMGAVPLTTAELRVLHYLPTHLSFPEIAKGLFVSRHTIKTQALAVYHKLGVSSRNEAVDRARTLGLLPSVPSVPSRSSLPAGG